MDDKPKYKAVSPEVFELVGENYKPIAFMMGRSDKERSDRADLIAKALNAMHNTGEPPVTTGFGAR